MDPYKKRGKEIKCDAEREKRKKGSLSHRILWKEKSGLLVAKDCVKGWVGEGGGGGLLKVEDEVKKIIWGKEEFYWIILLFFGRTVGVFFFFLSTKKK